MHVPDWPDWVDRSRHCGILEQGSGKTQMWRIKRLSLSIRSRLMGGLAPKAARGRCQLYMWVHAGKLSARSSEVW